MTGYEKRLEELKSWLGEINGYGMRLPDILSGAQRILNGALDEESERMIAGSLGIPYATVAEAVHFYSDLRETRADHVIRVCTAGPCYMAGADDLAGAFEKALGISAGEVTADGKFALEVCGCMGMCNEAPAVRVNGCEVGGLTVEDVEEFVDRLKSTDKI